MRLIDEPDALAALHAEVWTSADAHAEWREALQVARAPSNGEGEELPLALGVA